MNSSALGITFLVLGGLWLALSAEADNAESMRQVLIGAGIVMVGAGLAMLLLLVTSS